MAVTVLLVLMAAFIAAPYLYVPPIEPPVLTKPLSDWLAQAAAGDSEKAVSPAFAGPVIDPGKKAALFPFDPNTASAEEWERLGIPARTARTIQNYRGKGGRFRQPEDIRKIWGMPEAAANRLLPYVRITGTGQAVSSPNTASEKSSLTVKEPVPIDINTAGVAEWASLPGIGEASAGRVLRYREKAGGFRSVEQVGKTYGISDSVFRAILPFLRFNAETVPKTNLNTATEYELRSRAGISYQLAKDLVRYREQNGPYASLSSVRQLLDMPDSVWQKLIMRIKVE